MVLSLDSLKRGYLLLALIYYCAFLNFASNLFGPGQAEDMLNYNAGGNLPRQLMGVMLFGLGGYLFWRMRHLEGPFRFTGGIWWLLLIGYFCLSISWSYEPDISFRRVIAFSTLVLAAYVLVQSFEPVSLMRFFANAVGVAALIGLLLLLVSPSLVSVGGGLREHAFVGIFADKNAGARAYAYAVLILVGLGHFRTGTERTLLAVLLLALVLSRSATAAVILLAGLMMVALLAYLRTYRPQVNFHRLVMISALLLLGGLVCFYLYDVLLGLLGRDPTLTNRVVIWELMDDYVAEEPTFGYGFGAFWASSAVADFVDRWGYIGNAHSGYYEALLHGGIAGLGLVVALVGTSLFNAARAYIYHPQGLLFAPLISILILQLMVNYVAFVIINHNSFDMFLFALISFTAVRYVGELRQYRFKEVL
ncbi:O-antigen ligase family protein [Bowmanella dokdonensis]|uniref:O-antigen ligase family protein n=1 Tax=Bowmanella dokdonensis TaxID=751969 RepID=A0A939DM78_9ALTE|nr:O-antigen ligase family protein [Bowmanella dokdonensis]MBN7824695.1 O-antigen ligase family protein [Bowmanella dokdonensis]